MFRSFRIALLGIVLSCSLSSILPSVVRAEELQADFSEINGPITDKSNQQGIIFAGICTSPSADCPCRDTGNCQLSDVLQVFVNLSTFILGISGSAVLFVFVYGGFKWLFSRGEQKWVEAGKAAMTAGVIGLCIIFGSYVAINFIVAGLKTKEGASVPVTPLEETVRYNTEPGSDGSTGVEGVFTTE